MRIIASLCIICGFIGIPQNRADVLEYYAASSSSSSWSSLINPRYFDRQIHFAKLFDVDLSNLHDKEQNVSQIEAVREDSETMHQQPRMQTNNKEPSNSKFTSGKSKISGNDKNRLRSKKFEKCGLVTGNEIKANRIRRDAKKALTRDGRGRFPYEMREKSKKKPNNDVLFHKNHRKDKYKKKQEDKYTARFVETNPEIIPPNHKPRYSKEERGTVSKYPYIKTPSRYMEPPKATSKIPNQFYKTGKQTSEIHSEENRLKKQKHLGKQENTCDRDCEDEKLLKNHRQTHNREHDPDDKSQSKSMLEGSAKNVSLEKKKRKNPLILSQDGERIEFHIQGHQGPQTYLFGYDTGHGKNRHFRLEERLRDASVRGHYGYYDANGKLKMVEYKARPNEGYEEKHHDSRNYNLEEETKQSIS